MDVRHGALRRDQGRFRKFEHEVGSPDRPPLRPGLRRRSIGGVALGAPLLDPGEQRGTLAGGKVTIVGKPAVPRIRVPGGHAPLLDHLRQHCRVPKGIVEGDEIEAPHLPGAMATLAPFLDDRGDVTMVGDRPHVGSRFVTVEPVSDLWPHRPHSVAAGSSPLHRFRLGDQAPGHRRGGNRNVASAKHGVDCVAQRSLPGRVAGEVVAVLIVDRAAIADRGPGIEENDFVRPFHHQGIGLNTAPVEKDGKRGIPFRRPGRQRFAGLTDPRRDAEKANPRGPVFGGQIVKVGEVFVAERATG